jgi:hypothetical protein
LLSTGARAAIEYYWWRDADGDEFIGYKAM